MKRTKVQQHAIIQFFLLSFAEWETKDGVWPEIMSGLRGVEVIKSFKGGFVWFLNCKLYGFGKDGKKIFDARFRVLQKVWTTFQTFLLSQTLRCLSFCFKVTFHSKIWTKTDPKHFSAKCDDISECPLKTSIHNLSYIINVHTPINKWSKGNFVSFLTRPFGVSLGVICTFISLPAFKKKIFFFFLTNEAS